MRKFLAITIMVIMAGTASAQRAHRKKISYGKLSE